MKKKVLPNPLTDKQRILELEMDNVAMWDLLLDLQEEVENLRLRERIVYVPQIQIPPIIIRREPWNLPIPTPVWCGVSAGLLNSNTQTASAGTMAISGTVTPNDQCEL